MSSAISKGKEFFVRHKMFFLMWLLVSIKFYYETSGSVAGFFTVKFFACLLFYCAFALLLYRCYGSFDDKKEAALVFCSAVLFAHYCCMNRSCVYSMQIENYTSAAFLVFGIVFALKRQTLFFTLPLCLAALFISPETTAALIPLPLCLAFLNTGVPGKNESGLKQKSGKPRTNKKSETAPEKIMKKTARIPPAVTGIPLVIIFILSFVLYRRRNPYEAMFSIETAGLIFRNSLKVLLYFSPFFLFALVIWICILKARRNLLKELIFVVIASLLICATAFIIPKSALSAEAYLSTVLLCSFGVTVFVISRDKTAKDSVAAFALKYGLAAAVISIITAGICLKYYQ